MKKKWLSLFFLLAVFGLIFAGTNMYAEDLYKDVNFKIDLNNEMTAKTNSHPFQEKGLKRYFDKEKNNLPASFIQIHLKMKDGSDPNQVSIKGSGVIKVGTETYPIQLDDQPLPKYILPNGTVWYTGGLTGTIKTKAVNDTVVILGLDYDPAKDQAFMSAFVGELSETNGLGVLRFGIPNRTKEINDYINEFKNQQSEISARR
ncbi:hypothetical protein [Paenibacillus sp. URB8-2]|uniref:hypothetical protein n=1 Tax=Paenibacillus sp. URB8-2 TaxID=2741301 RepID=UPI0015C15C62|nr:hypothetical protein [Paenibacillus sp. URB8-2]BCG59777.1 hypothetical protein PUR_32020 [Paenibacillus sp. URB8-2]